MKKHNYVLTIILFLVVGNLRAERLPITEVTVYRNQASIVREGKVSIKNGENILIVKNLPVGLNRSTLQYNLGDDVQLISADWRKVKKERAFDSKKNSLRNTLDSLNIEKSILKSNLDLLSKNMDLGTSNTMSRSQELKELAAYYRKQERESRFLLLSINKRIEEVKRDMKKHKEATKKYIASDELELVINYWSSKSIDHHPITLSYLISGASWSTLYDLQMVDLKHDLQLKYKGEVTNNTGESWDKVSLVLSTGIPSMNLQIQELNPWWLREQYLLGAYDKRKKAMPMQEMSMNARGARGDDMVYAVDGQRVREASQVSEDINVTLFKISDLKSVPTHESSKTFTLNEQEVGSEYYYLARPKVSSEVMLMAKVKDWSDLMLSHGDINIYINGKYQGKTYLNPQSIDTELIIPMGIDVGIAVERKSVDEFRENKNLRTRKRSKRVWAITVKNNKQVEAKIILEDQVPLSAAEQIEVENINLDGGKLDKEKGIVQWELSLSPKTNITKSLSYEVEFPKGWNIRI